MIKFLKRRSPEVIGLSLGLLVILALVTWPIVFIKPGFVGIKVNMFGDNKGVDEKEMQVGAHFVPPWKKVYPFPVYEQNTCWEGNDQFVFQSRDGMGVGASIGITFRIRPECVYAIFQRYRRGVDEITDVFLRNYIRDALNKAASRYKIEDLYSTEKEHFLQEVQQQVQSTLTEIGVDVSRIYIIGRFQFPQAVVEALNRKIEAMQRAEQRENELREAEAEAKKVIATARGHADGKLLVARAEAEASLVKAEAKAKGNRMLAETMTPEVLKFQQIEAWDGKLPQTITGDAASLLLSR